MPRTSLRVAAAALVVALVPALAACSTGKNASTTTQQPSGNGSSASVGPLQLRGVTIVKGDGDLGVGTIIGTIVNTGTDPDVLTGVTVAAPTGATATIVGTGTAAGGQLELGPRTSPPPATATPASSPAAFTRISRSPAGSRGHASGTDIE